MDALMASYWPHSNPEAEPTSGRLCPGPHRSQDPPATDAPLCRSCTRRVAGAVSDLPELYVHLYLALEPGVGARAERSASGERALVLRLDTEQLMRDIFELVSTWAQIVRDTAGLSEQRGHRPRVTARSAPTRALAVEVLACDVESRDVVPVDRVVERETVHVRQAPPDRSTGWALTSSCRTLTAHVETWLALPEQAVARAVSTRQLELMVAPHVTKVIEGGALVVTDVTGVEAALEVLDVAHRARRALGQTRGKDRLRDAACPACHAAALVRQHGAGQVECEACGETWSEDDWSLLTAAVAAAARKRPKERHRWVPTAPTDSTSSGAIVPDAVHHLPDFAS
jgi:ribosomal protein S27E